MTRSKMLPFVLLMAITFVVSLAYSTATAKSYITDYAPSITAPDAITLTTDLPVGIPIDNAQIKHFLNSASAADAIGHKLVVLHDAPIVFVEGTTPVTFSAVDPSGIKISASTEITVVPSSAQ